MADYDRVIEMDENNLIARFNRGLLRAQVADNNRAIRDFDKVIELEPDNTIAVPQPGHAQPRDRQLHRCDRGSGRGAGSASRLLLGLLQAVPT